MMPITVDSFLNGYRASGAPLAKAADAALRDFAGRLLSDPEIKDVRWAAYMLATVRHECANTWRPIEEYGKGQGRPYGVTLGGHAYYGRGYVQLTWQQNYLKLGQALGLGRELVDRPSRVLEPEISYRILSLGMRKGLFTGKKLADYLNDVQHDYTGARRIINGTDRAAQIASYAEEFERLLRA